MNKIPTSVSSMIISILSDCQHSQNQTWINRALNLVKWMVWTYPDMKAEIIPAEVEKAFYEKFPRFKSNSAEELGENAVS